MHSNAMISKAKKIKKDKWSLNVTSGQKREAKVDLPSPPGYNPQVTNIVKAGRKTDDEDSHTSLVNKKAWDIALAPIKGLPMNVFIMYMSGNTISIFPIMMVGMMFFRPIQALMAIRATMKMLERSSQYILQTLVYMLGNLMAIGLAVYKCNSMGLLPTHASDWLSFASPLQRMEYSAGGITL